MPNFLANYLGTLGFPVPQGLNVNQFGRGQGLFQLLQAIQAPTGLENLYGPEFQQRAIGAGVERSAAPFQEAGRALTGTALQRGLFGGSLLEGREGLARGQGQTAGNTIIDLLLSLEGMRGENIQGMESIRQSRLSMLLNFLNALSAQHFERRGQGLQRDLAREANVQSGINATTQALI